MSVVAIVATLGIASVLFAGIEVAHALWITRDGAEKSIQAQKLAERDLERRVVAHASGQICCVRQVAHNYCIYLHWRRVGLFWSVWSVLSHQFLIPVLLVACLTVGWFVVRILGWS